MGTGQSVAVSEEQGTLNSLLAQRKESAYFLAVLLLAVVAALLRFHTLGNRGFWLDEAFSLDPGHQSEPNMALYYLLMRLWMKLGQSEAFLRTMSVAFSVATIPFTYAIGARLFGRNTGLLAAWLLTLNAFHIHYAQEARAYALAVLLGAVATYVLVRNVQQLQDAKWPLYGILLALLVYSHLMAVLLFAAHGACLLCLPPAKVPWKGMLRTAVWFVCLTLP